MKIEWNEKEKKLIKAFPGVGNPAHISELAKDAFPSMGVRSTTKGNSWARNSLRKPIKFKFVKQLGRGIYVLLSNPLEKAKKTSPSRGTTVKNVLAAKSTRTSATANAPKKTRTSSGTHVATTTSTQSGAAEMTGA